ncbi:MAG: MFS transporter [Pseudomonadota bacterium]
MNQVPARRIALLYFVYFGSFGAFAPYWTLYLQSLTFSPSEIGEFMAIIAVVRIFAPAVWGWFSDRTGKRMAIVRFCNLFALISFAAVLLSQNYWWLMLVMILFTFFWNAILPQIESTTLSWLGDDSNRYSRIRVWGSVGFVITAVGIGELLDTQPISILPGILVGLFALIWLASLPVPESPISKAVSESAPIGHVLRQPQVIAIFTACFLIQVSHAPYYTFYSIYLQSHDYSGGAMGGLWGLAVVAEIAVFLLMHRLHRQFSNAAMLCGSLLIAAFRWVLIAYFPASISVMIFAQILHAATFGLNHAVMMQLIHHYFQGPHQVRGQALYSSLSFGLGTALGTWISGYTWEISPQGTFLWAAGACVLGFFISWYWLRGDLR